MASTIGIKIANGEFYSIVEENSSVKKRLVLTTVHDKQRSVQIDLYRSFTKTMADALYIGSLVVEKIKPKLKGEPSIEMVIASSKEGTISADAIDLDASPNGEHHYLSVSLKSLDDDNRDYNLPDFELEQNEPPPTGLYEKANAIKEQKDKSFPWPVLVAAVLVLLAVIFGVWYTLFWEGSPLKTRTPSRSQPVSAAPSRSAGTGETAPPAQDEPAQPPREEAKPVETPKAEPSRTAPEAPVINAPAAAPVSTVQKRTRTPAPVSTYKVPTTIPKNGAPYTIRWGDTLWDIADAFYRNPWLYPRIARFNNIRNPDLIISGTTIRVPPRN